MKKVWLSCLFVLSLGLVACGGASSQLPSYPSSGPVPAPADTALYRGTVQSIVQDEEGTLVVLRQEPGTNFGAPELSALITEDTQSNFEVQQLKTGDYVEIYYGATEGGGVPTLVEAVAANQLAPAVASLHNGTVVEATLNDDGTARLLVRALNSEKETLYHITAETQVYLSLKALKPGDQVSILTNGIEANSLPPQATALEVRILMSEA